MYLYYSLSGGLCQEHFKLKKITVNKSNEPKAECSGNKTYYRIITADRSEDAQKMAKKRRSVLFPDKLAKKGLTYIANVAIILHVAAREQRRAILENDTERIKRERALL